MTFILADWLMLWPLLGNWGDYLHIVLKASIKGLPFFGWSVQLARYLFLVCHFRYCACLSFRLQRIVFTESEMGEG